MFQSAAVTDLPIGLAVNLRYVLRWLQAALRPAPADERHARRTTIASRWLDRLSVRLLRLIRQTLAGTLKAPERRDPARAVASPRAPAARWALPRSFGWLARLLPQSVPAAEALTALVEDAELDALIRAEPARFGRLLRPLYRALDLRPPDHLLLSFPRRRPRPAAPPPTRSPAAPAAQAPAPGDPSHHRGPPPGFQYTPKAA